MQSQQQRMNFFAAVVSTLLFLVVLGLVALGAFTFARNTQVTIGQGVQLTAAVRPTPQPTASPPAAAATLAPATYPETTIGNATEVIFASVNATRCAEGLIPLQPNAELEFVAARHAIDMAQNAFFAHEGSDGTTVVERANEQGYVWQRLGENIAAGMPTAEAAFEAWMNSPGHRANILEPAFREMGFFAYIDYEAEYSVYWVQVFGTPQREVTPPPCE